MQHEELGGLVMYDNPVLSRLFPAVLLNTFLKPAQRPNFMKLRVKCHSLQYNAMQYSAVLQFLQNATLNSEILQKSD